MTTITATPAVARPTATTRRRIARAATVVGTAVVAAAVFAVARASLGELTIADRSGGAPAEAFTAFQIFAATIQLGLIGWAVLAVAERFLRAAHRIWTVLGIAVLALSMAPIWLFDASDGTRTALVVLHLVVAAGLLRLPRAGR